MTYFSGFPCLLGLTILLLQTIFVIKKSNEKWKAQNKFVRFVQFVVKNNKLTPFLSGRGWGWAFPSQGAAHPQNKCFKCFRCFRCFRCFISLLDQKTPVFGPNRNKTGVSSVSGVSSVPHPYSFPFREGPGVGFSLSPSAKRG